MTIRRIHSFVRLLALTPLAVAAACAPKIEIVPRAEWGWEPAERSLPEHTISKITIHHGGSKYDDDRDTTEYLRALQKWSRSDKEWIDVPYHYVIDLEGRMFEGRPVRYPGDTNTSYDPRGHALIVVVGNYDNREFGEAQFESLARLTAHLALEYSIGPGDIKGHRDYAPGETSCPGTNVYSHLEDGSLLRRVGELTGKRP